MSHGMHVGALPLNYNSRSVRRLPFSTSGNYGPVCTENLIPWRRGRIGEGAILPLLVLLSTSRARLWRNRLDFSGRRAPAPSKQRTRFSRRRAKWSALKRSGPNISRSGSEVGGRRLTAAAAARSSWKARARDRGVPPAGGCKHATARYFSFGAISEVEDTRDRSHAWRVMRICEDGNR